jgi:hypothetical protein
VGWVPGRSARWVALDSVASQWTVSPDEACRSEAKRLSPGRSGRYFGRASGEICNHHPGDGTQWS